MARPLCSFLASNRYGSLSGSILCQNSIQLRPGWTCGLVIRGNLSPKPVASSGAMLRLAGTRRRGAASQPVLDARFWYRTRLDPRRFFQSRIRSRYSSDSLPHGSDSPGWRAPPHWTSIGGDHGHPGAGQQSAQWASRTSACSGRTLRARKRYVLG